MTTACLLDVNVVISLQDPHHDHYNAAQMWRRQNLDRNLALSPIVENGFLRIFGHPNYPKGPGSPARAADMLHDFKRNLRCRMLHDDVSLTDKTLFPYLDGYTSKQLTDIYLLGLAVSHGLCFATFDRKLPAGAVQGGDAAIEVVK